MKFAVGDSVQVIDDDIEGEIVEIQGDILTIETSDGFPMKFPTKDLVKIQNDVEPLLELESDTIAEALQEKEHFRKKDSFSTLSYFLALLFWLLF